MRAIQVAAFGGPEVLSPVDLPNPVPRPGEVVVGMAAADVILLDTLLRSGWGQDFFPLTLPYVPGGGGAGVVVETGDGVDPAWIGRRVVVRTSAGYAERVVADIEEIVPVPDRLAVQEAAGAVARRRDRAPARPAGQAGEGRMGASHSGCRRSRIAAGAAGRRRRGPGGRRSIQQRQTGTSRRAGSGGCRRLHTVGLDRQGA
jgi:hypothetical protein